jgi:hypothetical protein
MRDSDTYMAILEEGGVAEIKKVILRFGQKFLGPPNEAVKTYMAGTDDLERLELLHDRIPEVKSWQELLATP